MQSAPFIKSLKDMYMQSPQLFKETDLKENVVYTYTSLYRNTETEINPLKMQMLHMAQNMIEDGVSKDEILYRLRSFDNFVSAWVWHTFRDYEQVQLNERIAELFQGRRFY